MVVPHSFQPDWMAVLQEAVFRSGGELAPVFQIGAGVQATGLAGFSLALLMDEHLVFDSGVSMIVVAWLSSFRKAKEMRYVVVGGCLIVRG